MIRTNENASKNECSSAKKAMSENISPTVLELRDGQLTGLIKSNPTDGEIFLFLHSAVTTILERSPRAASMDLPTRSRKGICFLLVLLCSITASRADSSHYASICARSQATGHAAMLGRIEASIMGESALIDRETGRVYWEGGSSNTLYESLLPKLDQFGVEHAKATLLTVLITLAFVGVVAAWTRRFIDESKMSSDSYPVLVTAAWTVLEWTALRFPRIENKWLVMMSIILYVMESYNCSTRRFLANAISSPNEVEEYIENLRKEAPVVEWKVKCFHYERRKLFQFISQPLRWLFEAKNSKDPVLTPSIRATSAPMFPFTKKVISHQATSSYHFKSCLDSTIAGVWKRADATFTEAAPFTKIVLTKLLVLSNSKSRDDYFRQQSGFVTQHGQGDEFVEFSTDIQVAGYKPRMLAVRTVKGVPSTKLFRLHLFWIFTFMGLTVPYRLWFSRHCDYLRVTVVKETSADPVGPATPGKTWFPSRPNAQTPVRGDSLFRSFMQGLTLYTPDNPPIEVDEETAADSSAASQPDLDTCTGDEEVLEGGPQ